MKEILSYWQYSYLLCIGADWSNNILLIGSSNRAIKADVLLRADDDIGAEDLPLLSYSVFPRYFKLLSKGKDRLSKNEIAIQASIRDLFKRIKAILSEQKGILLETAQILFIMPLSWTEEHYKDKMRDFFEDIGWITPNDNTSKLIMIPAIQMLAECFKDSSQQKRHLDRERTSVLFSVQESARDEEDSRVKFTYTFFKMQSAKALITVSKTLASSDFWLVPSIISSDSLFLANLDDIMYNAVKKIIAGIRTKVPRCVPDNNTMKEDDPAWTIVCHLELIHESKFGLMSNKNKEIFLEDVIVENQHHLQDLENWTCSQLIAAIFEDAHVRHYFKQVSSFFKEALDQYGAVKNSPDGIQHALFYSDWISVDNDSTARQDYSDFIKQALIQENIIQDEKGFGGINLMSNARSAMQQSYKMIQIANSILPPVIVGEEEQKNSKFPAHQDVDSSIAPNSFYVQASVTETQISFILNKAIEVSSFKNDVQLFTIQERTVDIGHVAETALDTLWNHYQFVANLEEEQQQRTLFKCCQDHDTMALLSSHYKQFKTNAKKLVDFWIATENTFSQDGLDSYHLVLVDQQCTCALKLSQRLLWEIGLKPAIADIATTITSALFSNAFFGLYQLSALILRNNMKTIKNVYFSDTIDRTLNQALRRLLQVQHNRLLFLFHDEQSSNSLWQYIGRGNYSQVSSMTYTFKIELWPKENKEVIVGLLENGVCKRIPLTFVQRKRKVNDSLMFTYSGLTKEEDLPLDGKTFTFFAKGCRSLSIEAYVSDHSEKGTYQYAVGSMPYDFTGRELYSPITLKFSPKHHSSTIKFDTYLSSARFKQSRLTQTDMSKQSDRRGFYVFEVEKSTDIIERLSLKK